MDATNKVAGCRLRVAPDFYSTLCCEQDFYRKRNPQLLLIYVFCCIYLYYIFIHTIYIYIIIYNIIKNKK